MGDGLLAVEEEGVGRPDVAGQQVVQREHLHGPLEAQALVFPALAEKDVDGVLLQRRRAVLLAWPRARNQNRQQEPEWVILAWPWAKNQDRSRTESIDHMDDPYKWGECFFRFEDPKERRRVFFFQIQMLTPIRNWS